MIKLILVNKSVVTGQKLWAEGYDYKRMFIATKGFTVLVATEGHQIEACKKVITDSSEKYYALHWKTQSPMKNRECTQQQGIIREQSLHW